MGTGPSQRHRGRSTPGFTVWSLALPRGRNQLDFGRGAYVVLGVIRKNVQPQPRMVFYSQSGARERPDLDLAIQVTPADS